MRTEGIKSISGQTSLKAQARPGRTRGPLLLAMLLPLRLLEDLIQRLRGSRRSCLMRICAGVVPLLLCCLPAHAQTIAAASCSQTDVQNAINSAITGDMVSVPGGTCSWTSVTIPSTVGVTLNGGGNTTITSGSLFIQQNSNAETRVTGFTFEGNGNCGSTAVEVTGTTTSFTARVDHNTFSPSGGGTTICTYGNSPVLFDHNTFNILASMSGDEVIHNFGLGASNSPSGSSPGWTDSVTPGGPAMVFLEDNTFNFPTNIAYGGTSAIQSYYGARTVVRYNTIYNMQIDQHGTCGEVWARWWEIYNNSFITGTGDNQYAYMDLRGGSGVIFNNTQTGPNDGAGIIQLQDDCNTNYPDQGEQVGRGINGWLSPTYIWGNGASMTPTSTSSNIELNRDYYVSSTQPSSLTRCELTTDSGSASSCSTTYNYVPYTYPHPLQGSTTAPNPPTGLTAVAH